MYTITLLHKKSGQFSVDSAKQTMYTRHRASIFEFHRAFTREYYKYAIRFNAVTGQR